MQGKPVFSNKDTILYKWKGRFGNRMHIFAYLLTRSNLLGGSIFLPSHWEGSKIFNLKYNLAPNFNSYKNLNIKKINVNDPFNNYRLSNYCALVDDHCSYHASIFKQMNKKDLLKSFEFNDFVKDLEIYKRLEDLQGTYSIAHYRKLDLQSPNNKTHSEIDIISYKKAFRDFDIDPQTIHWVSDVGLPPKNDLAFDYEPAPEKLWKYPEGSIFNKIYGFDWLFDFLKMYFSKNLFRPYSSFSFWAGFLSQNRNTPTKVFCPNKESYQKPEPKIVNFIEGNHTHWAAGRHKNLPDLIIN